MNSRKPMRQQVTVAGMLLESTAPSLPEAGATLVKRARAALHAGRDPSKLCAFLDLKDTRRVRVQLVTRKYALQREAGLSADMVHNLNVGVPGGALLVLRDAYSGGALVWPDVLTTTEPLSLSSGASARRVVH